MSIYGEPAFADLLPAYYCNNYMIPDRRENCPSICKGILTHLIAMAITVGLCIGGYYYYNNIYLPQLNQTFPGRAASSPSIQRTEDGNKESQPQAETSSVENQIENFNSQMNHLKGELANMNSWRTTVNAHLTRLQWTLDVKISNTVHEALEIHEADDIGQMDYAASYAGGTIVAISRDTFPLPTFRPFSLFKIVNLDVWSSPEEIIRPCVLPGSCFAFRGDSGSIRIKLGKPISIGGITLSHASRLLLDEEGMSSAPKEFEVYGFTNKADESGTFLGLFEYDWMGRQHQTFAVKLALSKNQIFEEVALNILSNYGKENFTCVYRFRVHKGAESTEKSTQTNNKRASIGKKMTKCC